MVRVGSETLTSFQHQTSEPILKNLHIDESPCGARRRSEYLHPTPDVRAI